MDDDCEYVVYVLYSEKFSKTYTGFTSNLIQRFYWHNRLSKKGHTIRYRPWLVAYLEFYFNKRDAMKRERELKSSRGRAFIKQEIHRSGFISVS